MIELLSFHQNNNNNNNNFSFFKLHKVHILMNCVQ